MKFQNLDKKQLSQVLGGARPRRSGGKYHYYGNGVYCNRYYCHDNLAQMWNSVGHIAVNGWLEHGPWAH